MLKRFTLILLFCVAPFHLQAQTLPDPATYAGSPPASYVEQLLRSPDPRLHAWAAHFILAGQVTSLLPALEKLATANITAHVPGESRRALIAELDALDQLGGELPTEAIAALDPTLLPWQAHLLAGKPWQQQLPVWRTLYHPPGGSLDPLSQRVAAELLARHAAPGFAFQLLGSISVRATVEVHDQGAGLGVGLGGGCCGALGGAREALPWPVVASYAWFEPAEQNDAPPAGATLFLDGASPVYLVRTTGAPSFYCRAGLQPLNDRNRSHLAGILLGGVLLGGNPLAPFPEQPLTVDISFTGREAYRAQVDSFVQAQQRNFDSVAQSLTHAGLITEKERQSLALPIQLTLSDYRIAPRQDLPPVYFREPVLWTNALHPPF